MAIVMITIIFLVLTMMVEIAVHLIQIIGITFAKHVNVKIVPIFGLRKNVKRPRRTRSVRLTNQSRKIARVLAKFASTNRIYGCKIAV
jgi:hypothetical protein